MPATHQGTSIATPRLPLKLLSSLNRATTVNGTTATSLMSIRLSNSQQKRTSWYFLYRPTLEPVEATKDGIERWSLTKRRMQTGSETSGGISVNVTPATAIFFEWKAVTMTRRTRP